MLSTPLSGLLSTLSQLGLQDPAGDGLDGPRSGPYGNEPASHFSDSTIISSTDDDSPSIATPDSTAKVAFSSVAGDGKEELDRRLDALAQQALAPQFGFDDHDAYDADHSDADSIASGISAVGGETDGARMEMLKTEFGPLDLMPGEERFLTEVQGALIAQVLTIGRLFITTQRFAFYAVLPKLEEDLAAKRSNVLKSGPVVTQIPGFKGQRLFAVLSRDEWSIYRSAKDLYAPIASLPLVSVYEVLEADGNDNTGVRVRILKRIPQKPSRVMVVRLGCDTKEAADDWRREMAAALFEFNNYRDRFRVSVPLDRLVNVERTLMPAGNTGCSVTFDITPSTSAEAHTPLSLRSGSQNVELTKTLHFGVCPSDDTDVAGILEQAWQDVKTQRSFNNSSHTSPIPIVDVFEPPRPPVDDGIDDDPDVWSHQTTLSEEPETFDDDDAHDHTDAPEHRDEAKFAKRKQRIDAAFGLLPDELLTVHNGELNRLLPTCGLIGTGRRAIYFHSKRTGGDIKLRIPLKDVKEVVPSHAVRMKHYAVSVKIRGRDAVQLEVHSKRKRDILLAEIRDTLTALPTISPSASARSGSRPSLSTQTSDPLSMSIATGGTMDDYVREAQQAEACVSDPMPATLHPAIPKFSNMPFKPKYKSMRIHCLTIGSRGDVQPYIALCLGLMKEGHHCTIVSHPEFRDWVESYGINFKEAGGDPAVLMKVSVEHKILSLETIHKFRKWLDDLFQESYDACADAEVLLESPSTMSGIHVAEAYKISYIRCFTMPWTKTRDFPHALLSGPTDSLPSYNLASYALFENIVWRASSGQINRFRKRIGLQPTDLEGLRTQAVPFIYNFSEHVVPRPIDYPDLVHISGYWTIPASSSHFDPPSDIVEFIAKARADKKPLVYIGFGSITVPDPVKMTQSIVEAVHASDVRAILSKGWSARFSTTKDDTVIPPEEIYVVDSIPHDWLFKQIDAAMHHGGAGTTAASLTHGLTTLIHPFFGDQFFSAKRVQALGAGLRVKSLGPHDLTEALIKGTRTVQLKEKAELVGEKLRAEDGVANAINIIYRMLSRAAAERGGHAPGHAQLAVRRESTQRSVSTTTWPPTRSDSEATSPQTSPSVSSKLARVLTVNRH